MSAPRRWKDTHDAPVGVRELLSAGRAGPRPRALDGATFERGAARVAKLGAAPAAAATGVAVGVWTKLAAAAVIGVASVGAVVAVKHVVSPDAEHGVVDHANANASASANANASASASANARAGADEEARAEAALAVPGVARLDVGGVASAGTAAPPVRAVVVAPAVPPAIERSRSAAAPTVTDVAPDPAPAAPSPSPGTLGFEIALLEEARAALARDPTTALARVAQHRARFPSGVLGAERDLIELDALRRTGHTTEARHRARAWLEREPSGLHAMRVRAILASLDRSAE